MKRFLLTLTVLFSAIFSLVAKPFPLDFGEKVHIGVIGQNAPILHQVDYKNSYKNRTVLNYKNSTKIGHPLIKGLSKKARNWGSFSVFGGATLSLKSDFHF